MDNGFKNVWEGLEKKKKKKTGQSRECREINNLNNNQHKDTNGKPIMIENSVKQCPNEIRKLQSGLNAEQEKNLVVEKKFTTFECYLEEILQRNISYRILTKNIQHSSQRSDLLTATCKTMSYPQAKKLGQIDMQSKLLTHDFESMDIIAKGHDDVNFNKEAKSKYLCEEVNWADTNIE